MNIEPITFTLTMTFLLIWPHSWRTLCSTTLLLSRS